MEGEVNCFETSCVVGQHVCGLCYTVALDGVMIALGCK